MEPIFGMGYTQILLGFVRASGMIIIAPLFSGRNVIPQVKVMIAFALALVVAPFIGNSVELQSVSIWLAVFYLIQEFLVGLILGFMVNMTLYSVQLAGYFFDVSMGFSVVNILDPTTGTEMPIMGQFNTILALMVFLAINGHHTLIRSFIHSYEVVKPGFFVMHKEAVGVMVMAFSNMFYLGFKIGIPVLGAIFLTDVALGIISKLIPQINVFIVGFPVKIILGVFMLMVFLPLYVMLVEASFSNSGDAFRYMRLMLQHLH